MSVKQLKVVISFKQDTERDLYDFLKSKRNYSVYIKDLLERELNAIELNTTELTTIESVKKNKNIKEKENDDDILSNILDEEFEKINC